jgi:hypothetical protein
MKNEKINIPSWAQGVIAVASIAAIGLAVYAIHRKIKNEKALQSSKEETNAADSEIKKLTSSGVKATMNGTQLSNTVNGLKNAFLNYDAITRSHAQPFYREIAKVSNDLDMLNLIKAYKIQTIDFPIMKFTANDFTGGLTETAKNFLNKDEITAANNMLARKGIKYRF